ncbi:hypothetical protein LSTR_LSTR007064 [Laodelphax striatellus]|uniref:WASH complex subunit 4 n=1 Tax=Laodelphax striatellus TaxID=195883 RepID=A0A482WKB6_LAOST|nr:hypothetical protein LSTR_LSTR007064 [Laodelphax striatellus]
MWYDGMGEKNMDTLHNSVAEAVLRHYGRFVEDQSKYVHKQKESWTRLDSLRNLLDAKWQPREDASLLAIVDSSNKVLDKVVVVFSVLVLEVEDLYEHAEKNVIQHILFYGERCDEDVAQEEAEIMVSKLLPKLQELMSITSRAYTLIVQLVQQMTAFFSSKELLSVVDSHLPTLLDSIGKLLFLLVLVDEIFANQNTLSSHWTHYRHSVASAIHNHSKFAFNADELKRLNKFLGELDENLLSGKCFSKCQNLQLDGKLNIQKNSQLAEKFNSYLKSSLTNLDSRPPDMITQRRSVEVFATYVFSISLFGGTDKKLFKLFWEVSKKHHAAALCGTILWLPDVFLVRNLQHITKQMLDKKTIEAVASGRQLFITQTTSNLAKELAMYSALTCKWINNFEIILKQIINSMDYTHLTDMLLQGIQLMSRMKRLTVLLINLHGFAGQPMSKGSALILCKFVEIIKGIEFMYQRHNVTISKHLSQIVHQLCYRALLVIVATKKKLFRDKKYMEKVDTLSSLVTAERALDGPPTVVRLIVANLAISLTNNQHTFSDEDSTNLNKIMTCLQQVQNLQKIVDKLSKCEFIYWHKVVLPIYFDRLRDTKLDLQRIIYMMNAAQDSKFDGCLINHIDDANQLLQRVDEQLLHYVDTKLVNALCQDIETNLRLQIHSHLRNDESNLKKLNCELTDLSNIESFFLFHSYVHLKSKVESYLQRTFYDLTTVALHDWRTYGEMRSLAKHKYRLITVEDNLPSQTLEQGLDVLEIMRNIHIFVSKYMYNLNNQIFVESSSNNKHLNTINIRHVANSIRTHGTGIMNTTVNFTYQFLRKKLDILSQFLYDDHIKSKLLKESNFYQENRNQLHFKYPYERAVKLNKDIQSLGTVDGLSYMDKFRILITHIGNALGYVRMIRSGGLHCCSNAISFIPDIEHLVKFNEIAVEENATECSREASTGLDRVVTSLARNLTEGTEYFKLLVDVFAPVFQDAKNSHLRNFHMIVPALTVNFCRTSVSSKERLSKKSKEGAAFTDDGFAMGIAYMLQVINLNNEFDSLRWFESVGAEHRSVRTVAEKKWAASTNDDKLQQTLKLTLKRIHLDQQEFNLIYCSLSSARIFFQDSSKVQNQENKTGDN